MGGWEGGWVGERSEGGGRVDACGWKGKRKGGRDGGNRRGHLCEVQSVKELEIWYI